MSPPTGNSGIIHIDGDRKNGSPAPFYLPIPIEYVNKLDHSDVVYCRQHPAPGDLQTYRQRTLSGTPYDNDLDAINGWLLSVSRKRSVSTERAYRKEACRFFNWATVYGKRPFHRLRYEDLDEYVQFLNDPVPAEIWVADKVGAPVARGKAGWRAFRRPEGWEPGKGSLLSKGSIEASLRALKVMFAYFVETNYLWSNPVKEATIKISQQDLAASKEKRTASSNALEDKSVKQSRLEGTLSGAVINEEAPASDSTSKAGSKRSADGKHSGENYMPTECMEQLIDASLEIIDVKSRKASEAKGGAPLSVLTAVNQACILGLMYYQCLRAQEACLLKESDIHPSEGGLVITVMGKGGKQRNIPVRSELIDFWDLVRERSHPSCCPSDAFNTPSNSNVALIQNRRGAGNNDSMSYGYDGLNRLWVRFTSDVKPYIDKRWHNTVSHATTHWLRHSGATRLLSEGVSVNSVSHLLGHATLLTTQTYLHDRNQRLRSELNAKI